MTSLLIRTGYCLRVHSSLFRYSVVYGKNLATWTDRLKRWHSSPKSDADSKAINERGATANIDTSSTESGADDASLSQLLKEKDETIEKQSSALDELKDKHLRALAETENVRQRMGKLVEDARTFGIQRFAKDMLEIADILEKAIDSVNVEVVKESSNEEFKSLHKGLIMTSAQLQKIFKKNGLDKINPKGEKFNPDFHEVLYQVQGDKPGFVTEVTQIGYLLHGRTIRPAKVGVFVEQQ